MKRWQDLLDNAPERPNYTCPIFDGVQASVKISMREIESSLDAIRSQVNEDLEAARTANEELRENGIYWYEIAGELHKELREAQDKIDQLEYELSEARSSLDKFESIEPPQHPTPQEYTL